MLWIVSNPCESSQHHIFPRAFPIIRNILAKLSFPLTYPFSSGFSSVDKFWNINAFSIKKLLFVVLTTNFPPPPPPSYQSEGFPSLTILNGNVDQNVNLPTLHIHRTTIKQNLALFLFLPFIPTRFQWSVLLESWSVLHLYVLNKFFSSDPLSSNCFYQSLRGPFKILSPDLVNPTSLSHLMALEVCTLF